MHLFAVYRSPSHIFSRTTDRRRCYLHHFCSPRLPRSLLDGPVHSSIGALSKFLANDVLRKTLLKRILENLIAICRNLCLQVVWQVIDVNRSVLRQIDHRVQPVIINGLRLNLLWDQSFWLFDDSGDVLNTSQLCQTIIVWSRKP